MRDVHMSVEERGTIDFDLREQRAERAILGVMAGGAHLRAGLFPRSSYGFLRHGRMRMTAAAGEIFGRVGMNAACSIAAGKQRMERLPEQPERRKREQRAKRETAIDSGNQG